MTVGELIEILKTKDQDAVVVKHGVRGYHSRYDSINVTVDDGYWLVDHPRNREGFFIYNDRAHQIMDDGQTFLDFSAPTVIKAIQIHWDRKPTSYEVKHGLVD